MAAEPLKKLLNKAGALLARRPYARGELKIRLAKEADEESVEAVLNHLEQLKLLNDAEYAYNFALYRTRQDAWGAMRIRRSLTLRYVAPEVIEAALLRVHEEIGEQTALDEYIERQFQKRGLPTDRKGIQKLILHLRRRGFTDDIVYSALRRVIPPAAWQCFETGD